MSGRRSNRVEVKECKGCLAKLAKTEFGPAKQGKEGLNSRCRACCNAKYKSWLANNPDKRKRYRRATTIKSYGISVEEHKDLLNAQDSLCAICKQPETTKRKGKVMELAIDHCHTSGKVRGLLCNNCNRALGLLLDNPDIAQSAADYLRSFK